MADRIVVLQGGHVEQVGSPLELFHRPANRFVAGFIGNPNMNFLPAEVLAVGDAGISIRIENGPEAAVPVDPAAAAPADQVTLGIRPDDLRIVAQDGFPCRVDVVERLGNSTVVYLFGPEDQPICMVTDGTARLAHGDQVQLGFDPADAHLFAADGQAFHRRHILIDLEPAMTRGN